MFNGCIAEKVDCIVEILVDKLVSELQADFTYKRKLLVCCVTLRRLSGNQ